MAAMAGPPRGERLLSLDVFRGMTIAGMILVNNAGDWGHVYSPLEHAEWNGCTPTDLIFPGPDASPWNLDRVNNWRGRIFAVARRVGLRKLTRQLTRCLFQAVALSRRTRCPGRSRWHQLR